jgi:NADH-quinone oxidoreductase subunit F
MGTSGISAGAEAVLQNFHSEIESCGLQDKYEVIPVGDRGLFRDVLVDVIEGERRLVYENITPADVSTIVKEHLVGGNPVEKKLAGDDYRRFFEGQMRIVLKNCGEINPECISEYLKSGGYEGLKKALKMSREAIIDEMKLSGLKGRGGGGFSTGMKWEFTYKSQNDKKYVVCNADEGDPGAFMDRSILEGDPHAVLEGMAVAGYTIGADEAYIYCRAEYPLAIKRLKIAIEEATEKGFLGDNILGTGFSFKIHIKEGAGAFVCGEETSLLRSIEGKRGMPVPRPPFPAVSGLWQKPTLINNVETFANVRHIIERGAAWYSSIGTENSKGTKVFALSGNVKNTGLIEVPMGTIIRELIEGPGGGLSSKKAKFKGVQLGGPSGGTLPEELLDTPIDYLEITKTGAIMGSGGMVVMDHTNCMVDLAKFFTAFTVAESCGKCVPCRVGLKRMHEVLEKITSGNGTMEHIQFLEEMGNNIRKTALCGLGQTAPNPVLTTLRYYRDEYLEHVNNKSCKALACVDLVAFEVVNENCVKCGACKKACPVNAITWEKGEYAVIDNDKCIRCKSCIAACKFQGIR